MSNLKLSPPADPCLLSLFQEALARAGTLPNHAAAAETLWPRFAGFYRGLARLPRKARRALQRHWRRSLGGLALLLALGQAPALAATISVGGACTLIDAITAANNDAPTGGCAAGSGADTIALPPGSTHTLTAVNNTTYDATGLPVITSRMTIDGNSLSTIIRDSAAPPLRVLVVGAGGNLTLRNTTVSGGVASLGGGIENHGTLTLEQFSTVSGNTATDFGGGIENAGTLTLDSSTVSGNTAYVGGGGIANGGTLTLNLFSTISGNTARGQGGGIYNVGTVATLGTLSSVSGNTADAGGGGIYNKNVGTVTLGSLSTVSGNTSDFAGGGIENRGTLTLTNSTVSGNTARGVGGGIENSGTLTLNFSTVSGNTVAQKTIAGRTVVGVGGGIFNSGAYNGVDSTLTLTGSSVTGNSAQAYGGGIISTDTLTLHSSTVSGNTAGTYGGGVVSGGLMTVTNSTVSGNSAGVRGGGVNSTGTLTLTNSTISGNASGRVGGGLFNLNTGTVTLIQSLLSGNSAPVLGPEAYNASGTVIGDSFNLFGHDGFSGVTGFTLGATDLVPSVPVPAILDPTLSNNGGPTQTHGLVFGSPALDAVPGAGCATAIDQRGAPRPQDADGDTVPDCDIGAVERGLIPIQAEILSTTLDCRGTGCRVSVRCNLLETECRNPIDITVRSAAVRAADGSLLRAPSRFRFAAGVTNIPPGGTQTMRLRLTRRGTRVVGTTERKRLNGLLAIREIATATNTPPATISNTRVKLRLRRR